MDDFSKSRFIVLRYRYNNGTEYYHLVIEDPYYIETNYIFEFTDLEFLKLKFCVKREEHQYQFNIFNLDSCMQFADEFGVKSITRVYDGMLKFIVFNPSKRIVFETHSYFLDGVYQIVRNNTTNLWILKQQ